MSNQLWKALLVAPAVLGMATFAASAQASEPGANSSAELQGTQSLAQVQSYGNEGKEAQQLDQVTSVSQLSDVKPTDWAFQALQSLVERYGCIAGYPDKTYRGNQSLSRYEFAAGMNACLDKINDLIAAGTADLVRKEDLEALQKLQEEFAAELAALRGRVDSLEVRTATLEKQQFSTTTKLRGEVIFAIADTFGNSATRNGVNGLIAGTSATDRTNTIFADRVRLNLNTSFNGKDLLNTRLAAANITNFSGAALTGTNETRLGFDGSTGTGNSVLVDKLFYRFNLGDNLAIQVDAINNEVWEGLVNPVSPVASSGSGSVSRFGRMNPIYRSANPQSNGTGSAGFTFSYKFTKEIALQGGVVTDASSNDPGTQNGLFNGDISYIAQLYYGGKKLSGALTYAYTYQASGINITSSTGSAFAANPFNGAKTSVNAVAAQAYYRISPQILVGGWFGAQFAKNRANTSQDATILNGMVYLGFPDLGKKGSLGAIMFGIPPKVTKNDLATRRDNDTSYHLEAFYRYKLNDNIAITPGLIVIFNPEGNKNNDTQYVGVIRTTFTF